MLICRFRSTAALPARSLVGRGGGAESSWVSGSGEVLNWSLMANRSSRVDLRRCCTAAGGGAKSSVGSSTVARTGVGSLLLPPPDPSLEPNWFFNPLPTLTLLPPLAVRSRSLTSRSLCANSFLWLSVSRYLDTWLRRRSARELSETEGGMCIGREARRPS